MDPAAEHRRNLVLLRVGPNSLHEQWFSDDETRNWDLVLSPYVPIEPQRGVQCTVGDVVPGPKWSGLREVLHTWSGWRDYEQIWLPDDDILASQRVINDMFDVASGVGLDLFAPALDEHSHYAHFDMLRNRSFFGRWVGFVEIMVPGFSCTALDRLLPTLDLSETGWGLGLDSVWPKLLGYRNVGVIDGLTVTHTRPIGQRRDEELAKRMLDESNAILERYDCRQEHVTFGAFGADLVPLNLAPEALLAQLVCGWQYVFEQDPRVLAWVVDHQSRFFTWPAYPVEGTPDRDPPAGAATTVVPAPVG
jgi:hypothetical protein